MGRARPSLSLLEAAVLAGVVGTALAIFVPTFVERVRTNKIVEASTLLQELSHRAATYYGTTWESGRTRCLPPEAGPTPLEPTVDAESVDFFSPEATGYESWEALGFQPSHPIRYSYQYIPADTGCNLGGEGKDGPITFRAEGDLDGDGVPSRLERQMQPTLEGTLEPIEWPHVFQRVE